MGHEVDQAAFTPVQPTKHPSWHYLSWDQGSHSRNHQGNGSHKRCRSRRGIGRWRNGHRGSGRWKNGRRSNERWGWHGHQSYDHQGYSFPMEQWPRYWLRESKLPSSWSPWIQAVEGGRRKKSIVKLEAIPEKCLLKVEVYPAKITMKQRRIPPLWAEPCCQAQERKK